MLNALDIQPEDRVVEFAPGLGITAQIALNRNPATYTAVEQNEAAAKLVRSYLNGAKQKCIVGTAENTGLPEESATVIYGEAMLTLETQHSKMNILQEAYRLLAPGGRYAIHELCLMPDALPETKKKEIQKNLAALIRGNTRPLTPSEWRKLMETVGFSVQIEKTAPMHLLEGKRFIQDEGLKGTLKFVGNLLRSREAMRRVWKIRGVFRKHRQNLAALVLVGVKHNNPEEK
jgi:ubiquinone/menaquinone biosynthesis C-methylase UbiE